MPTEEHLYSIALRKCGFVGDINYFRLVTKVGSAAEVWKSPKTSLKKIDGVGNSIIKDIGSDELLKFAEKEIEFCTKNNVRIRLRQLGELPSLLNDCEDAPAILYQKGDFDEDLQRVSLVGTRNYTAYGKQFIEDFFYEIHSKKLVSVSGLALGTDTEVHEQSIKNKIATVAVLAHGFHTIYPSKNKKLAEKILEVNGALLTEFNTSHKPDRENFIQRNRIIAGLSPVTIVVETAFGGGSMSTANFANGYNRDVFALPGDIYNKYSQGCNQLIYQNKAAIISTHKDLLADIGILKSKAKMEPLFPAMEIKPQLSENQSLVYDLVRAHPHITLDEISEKLDLPPYKISPILLELELLGFIKPFSGKQYKAIT